MTSQESDVEIHNGNILFIYLRYYIIIPEGWKSLLLIYNLLSDSRDVIFFQAFLSSYKLCEATCSGGKLLITFTQLNIQSSQTF